jgi:thiol-disulfide isomerase/thioredoxin
VKFLTVNLKREDVGMPFLLRTILLLQLFAAVCLSAADRKFDFSKLTPNYINAKGEKKELNMTGKKYILVYYSSHWCGSCREFTPLFIDFYKENSKDLFEVVFMSLDFSKEKQLSYMQDSKMPWLGVEYSQLKPSGLFDFVGCVMPWIAVFKSDGTHIPNNKLNMVSSTAKKILVHLRKIMSIPEKKANPIPPAQKESFLKPVSHSLVVGKSE